MRELGLVLTPSNWKISIDLSYLRRARARARSARHPVRVPPLCLLLRSAEGSSGGGREGKDEG